MVNISLPLPPKELSPNGRNHWARKARAVRNYRRWAEVAAIQARPHGWVVPHELVVTCRFYFRDKRRRDRDNLLASMKAAFDGIVDSGLIRDDCDMIHMPVAIGYDRERQRVEITVAPPASA